MRLASWLVAGSLVLTLAPAAGAQQRISLSVTLERDTARSRLGLPPVPRIRTAGFAADDRLTKLLEEQVPVRLRYQVELWRSRALNDALERPAEFEILIRLEPLYDQYSMVYIFNDQVRGAPRVSTLAAVDSVLRAGTRLVFRAQALGDYYYTVKVTITALSDTEMADYERFVQGDAAARRQSESSSLARSIRRLFLRLSGMGPVEIDGRSDRFTVTRIAP